MTPKRRYSSTNNRSMQIQEDMEGSYQNTRTKCVFLIKLREKREKNLFFSNYPPRMRGVILYTNIYMSQTKSHEGLIGPYFFFFAKKQTQKNKNKKTYAFG